MSGHESSLISRLWWGGNPDDRHPVSGLSLRDINNLQKSWKKIQENSIDNGILMFVRLFRAQPESKLLFPSVANLNRDEEIAANIAFRAHTVIVMSHLDNTIINLNKPELVVILTQKIGDTHRRLKAERKHFLMFRDCLVNILQNDLKFTEDVVESWNRYFAFTYEHLIGKLASPS